jgi:hypothetical protein
VAVPLAMSPRQGKTLNHGHNQIQSSDLVPSLFMDEVRSLISPENITFLMQQKPVKAISEETKSALYDSNKGSDTAPKSISKEDLFDNDGRLIIKQTEVSIRIMKAWKAHAVLGHVLSEEQLQLCSASLLRSVQHLSLCVISEDDNDSGEGLCLSEVLQVGKRVHGHCED